MLSRRRVGTTFTLAILLASLISLFVASSVTPSDAFVDRKTIHAWPFPAGTGEGVLAVDPTDPERMVYNALGLRDNVPFYSRDGGSTWNESFPFTITTPTGPLDPWIAYDSQGRVYASTFIGNVTHPFDYQYPYLAKSIDHGVSFTLLATSYSPPGSTWAMPDGSLKPSCFERGVGAIDFPKIAADNSPTSPYRDHVYIVGNAGVNNTGSPFCNAPTSFIRSSDGGATWDIHRVLAGQDNQTVIRPNNLVVAPNGTIYFATTYTGGGVLLVYSKDGGMTWSTKPIPLGFGTDEEWMAVSKANSDNLYIVFEAGNADGSLHISIISSRDGGATWTSPTRLDDVLSNDKVDHTLPTMDISLDGHIFVAWRDYRNTVSKTWSNSNTTDIYAYSSANPRTNIRISNSTGRFCGPFSPCYRVSGNDFFGVASAISADHVAFSLDENGDSWSEAYDGIVQYSATNVLSSLPTTIYRTVTGSYLVLVGLVGTAAAIATIVVTVRRRTAARSGDAISPRGAGSAQNSIGNHRATNLWIWKT